MGPGTWDLGPGIWDLGPGTWDLGPNDRYKPLLTSYLNTYINMNRKILLTTFAGFIILLSSVVYYLLKVDLLGGLKYLKNATRAFEDVTIRELDYGVKYIDAETYEGALYGLGVVHARDRLWQMYFFRYLA